MNYRLDLCYDGTKYSGWQRLKSSENTVQGKVEAVLSRLLHQNISVDASGRTDAGVHARLQVCSFRAETELDCVEILNGMRSFLPSDIGALSIYPVSDRFHARYNCCGKTYVYRVWTSAAPNVFERQYLYFFRENLNIAEMRRAADELCGEHDFSAFTSAKRMKKSAVRRIDSIELTQKEGELRLAFRGNGFLYNMVRILTGTLLEVGTGRRSADSIPDTLAGRDRARAGFLVPASGLILWDLDYGS
ncbi:MAG: tRNA pseudouridine(38-40) synthase TruA [Oscillospiraceae bacterium]|nr:tRNA pseudouridine(38-40) synthase TruA [Oscillospiraceae bacterium]